MKKILKPLCIVLLAVLIVVVGYVAYVFLTYYRIDDNTSIEVNDKTEAVLSETGTYRAVTYNIGFGAYSPDFTFFMDGGTESVAFSKEAVLENTNGSIDTVDKLGADFILMQEVDIDSTRSYHTNQLNMVSDHFNNYDVSFAQNYDSAFLCYPVLDPHGKSKSGIALLSKYNIESAVRRSLPISESFSKLLDLDRCFSVNNIPCDNGKSLYIYNVHLSAYGGSPEIRAAQVNMLVEDMKEKLANDNYVICAGDFNHTMPTASAQEVVTNDWATPFPHDELPKEMTLAENYVNPSITTCHDCDVPYVDGVSPSVTVDGFLVSDNIEVLRVENLDAKFMYSDHNPVVLDFKLLNQIVAE